MQRREQKASIIGIMVIVWLAIVIALPVDSYAWKAVRPIMGTGADEGTVVGYKDEEIPDDRVPMGVNEVTDAVGVFAYSNNKIGLNMTADKIGVDTSKPLEYISSFSTNEKDKLPTTGAWNARSYIQYHCSYQGMEVKPLKDYVGDFQFDLIDKSGRIRTRKVYQFRKPYYGEGGVRYKNLVYFFEPPDLRGMSILVSKPVDETQADDQWIYLPALRRVRRISAAQKMDAFGGTDMTNDQIDRATGMWDAKIVGETDLYVDKAPLNNCYGAEAHRDLIDGRHCVMIELTPRNKDWPVSREISYYDKATGAWYYEETYDKGGRLVKILLPFLSHMYAKEPRYWTYGDFYAHDLRTDHKTMMYLPEKDRMGYDVLDYKTRDWSNYVFWYDVGYSDEYTSKRFMERGTR